MSESIVFSQLVRQIGLEELSEIGAQEIAQDFMPAAIAGLAEGDILVMHQQPYADRLARLYGEHFYNEGEVARSIGRQRFRTV